MNSSDLLLAFCLVIIAVLLGVVTYLSQRKVHDRTDDASNKPQAVGSTSTGGLSTEPSEIHIPGPRLQPELGVATSEAPRYQRRDYLFSYQERKFHDLLSRNFGEDWQIFAKVRMADLVDLANEPKDRGRYINWILTRHIDFVICEKPQQRPRLGIELNDSSHTQYDRAESDKFKKSVFEQVGLPLLPFDAKTYKESEVVNQIREALANHSISENTERQSQHG
ncbi:MAG: DUF2726 domain-containing protein [Chloroflexi bacterium]|nr:DUF2726 domain-containing protein [Chloroflexota bacterium]